MHRITMTEQGWSRLLDMKSGADFPVRAQYPEEALYGPIASCRTSFVLAQVGQSLDGRVATPAGDARDISGPEGIAHLHRCRALVDAVIVGVGTVRADNPRLSVRAVPGPDPVRVVIDCRGDLTGEELLFSDGGAPVIIIQNMEAPRSKLGDAEIIRLPEGRAGLDPGKVLEALGQRGLSRVLVEGGARTISRFITAGLVDRLHVSIAPLIIGSGPSGITLPPVERLSSAFRPVTSVYMLGGDILFDCWLKAAGPAVSKPAESDLVLQR